MPSDITGIIRDFALDPGSALPPEAVQTLPLHILYLCAAARMCAGDTKAALFYAEKFTEKLKLGVNGSNIDLCLNFLKL